MGINWTEFMDCGHVLAASLDENGQTGPCLWCKDIAVEREACARVVDKAGGGPSGTRAPVAGSGRRGSIK